MNSWPTEDIRECDCYLTIFDSGGPNIEIDFNFTIDSAPMLANLLFQLDSGALTGTIVDAINQQCVLVNREEEFAAFMTALSVISMTNTQIIDVEVSEPVIKPSQVFKYTVDQPKLN